MNPVSASSPPPDPSAAQPDGLTTNLVSNIPVHSQGAAAPGTVNEDDELDKIMQDVNHEIKKTEKKPDGHHFHFERRHHKKTDAKFSAQPRQVMDVHTQPVQTPTHNSAPAPAPVANTQTKPPANSRPAAQPKSAAPVKPSKTSHTPVMAIVLTLVVTSGLIAAAIYAYK